MYDPSNEGGLAIYTKNVSNALAKEGCDVYLLTANPYIFQKAPGLLFHVNDSLFAMEARPVFQRSSLLWAADRTYKHCANVRMRKRFADALHPAVIHIQVTAPIIDVFYLPYLKKKYKIVYTVHDVFAHTKNLTQTPWALKRIYEQADHLIVHAKSNKSQLQQLFGIEGGKITVIPHGTHIPSEQLPEKEESRRVLNLPPDAFIILFFGVIRANKGLALLIKSLLRVVSKHRAVALLIAGSPPFKDSFEEYQQLIEELAMQQHIISHIRFIPDDMTQHYYRASDIVALPYTSFGSQSGVLLQAYYYQRPVIVTDAGGMGEQVKEDDSGIVISPGSCVELSDAIIAMLESPAAFKQYACNMLRAAREKYSWDIVAQKTLQLYIDICNAPTRCNEKISS